MKSVIIFFFLLPVFCIGQIEITEVYEPEKIGEVKIAGMEYINLTYWDKYDLYTFQFRNLDYSHIVDIESFSIPASDIDVFYDTIIENIRNSSDKELEIVLPDNEKLKLKFAKKKVAFWLWDGVSWSYTWSFKEKNIKDLFNRE